MNYKKQIRKITYQHLIALLLFINFTGILSANPVFKKDSKRRPLESHNSKQNSNPIEFATLLVPRNSTSQTASKSQKVPPSIDKAIDAYEDQIERISIQYPGNEKGNGFQIRRRDYRGNFYEYFRNDALDALPHEVRQANKTKSTLRRHQFGFNLTGPLIIPQLYNGKNKTFFSITYEGTREKRSDATLAEVPTVQQRLGDFSDLVDHAGRPVTIYDPATTRLNPDYDSSQPISRSNLQYLRDPFPGNRIPENRIDPVAKKAVAYYPLPNANIGPFLQNNYFTNMVQTNTPNGTILNIDHRRGMNHKLTWNSRFSSGIDGSAPIFDNAANPGRPDRRVSSSEGDFTDTLNISPNVTNQFKLGFYFRSDASVQVNDSQIDFPNQLGLSGIQPGVFPNFEIDDMIDLGSSNQTQRRYKKELYFAENGLIVRKNNHTFNLVFQGFLRRLNSFRSRHPSGSFDFGGQLTSLPGINNTGSPFAQFLLGMADRALQSIVLHPSYHRAEVYKASVKHEYKITPQLNWNFRLRLRTDTGRREKYNRQSTLDLKGINPANGLPGVLIFAGKNGIQRSFIPTHYSWLPGAGLAFSPSGDRNTVIRAKYTLGSYSLPLYPIDYTSLGFNSTPLLVSSNKQLEPAMFLRKGFPPVNSPQPTPDAANNLDADYVNQKGKLNDTHEWKLEVEKDVFDFSFKLGYTGERGNHLFRGARRQLNPLHPDFLKFRDQLNDLEFRQSLRPFPHFQSIVSGDSDPTGFLSHHAGSLRIDKQLSSGLTFSSSYRFSKTITDMSHWSRPQNSTNLLVEKGLADSDRTHRVTASYLYELPLIKTIPFQNTSWLVNTLIDGWRLSGIAKAAGGNPIGLRSLFNNTGGIAESLRVNVVPTINPHVDNPSPLRWFNPSAFVQPPDFTLGDGSRRHPTLRNPSLWNVDMSLSKRMILNEDWTMDLIAEAFNTFNHANWNRPDSTIGSIENPNINAGRIIGSRGGRVVQLGLRFNF